MATIAEPKTRPGACIDNGQLIAEIDFAPFQMRVATDRYRGADGALAFPAGVTGRLLLQQATRDRLTDRGLDVERLTDTQMSDNHFHLTFPNLFMTIRAGEATVILATPHPDGAPGRSHWHVQNLMWLPPEQRAAAREALTDVPAGEHFAYFLALEQDWHMMQRQQRGLSNQALGHMALTRQEVRLAHFHAALDAWTAPSASHPPEKAARS